MEVAFVESPSDAGSEILQAHVERWMVYYRGYQGAALALHQAWKQQIRHVVLLSKVTSKSVVRASLRFLEEYLSSIGIKELLHTLRFVESNRIEKGIQVRQENLRTIFSL